MKQQLIDATEKYIEMANELFGTQIEIPTISFDLKGRTAGTANGRLNRIRYNLYIAQDNFEAFVERTVPHEVAHIVVHHVYPNASAHGREWKGVMRTLGVRDITRCHSYDLQNVPVRRQLRFSAWCGCENPHKITTTLRNKMMRGHRYSCRTCGQSLKLG
jgi:SprT protein